MGTVSVISKEKPFTQLRLSTLPPTDILGTVNVIDHGLTIAASQPYPRFTLRTRSHRSLRIEEWKSRSAVRASSGKGTVSVISERVLLP